MPAHGGGSDGAFSGTFLFIGVQGASLTTGLEKLLRDVRPGGIILFKRNVASLTDLPRFCDALRSCVDPPPLIAIDEEGGRVTRLQPHVTGLPAAYETARAGPEALRRYWRSYGELLAALGVDIDFAPVVDLCPPDAPNGIADRSYATDPKKAAACAAEAIAGLLEAGVLPTLKHFPGLGNTLLDSHHNLPAIQKDRAAFEQADLLPFAELAPRCPAVMVGHGHYPFYSGPDPLAATLSREICTDLLRDRIGFEGAAVSDDLEMKAVAARISWDVLAPRAIAAGNDMVLICHDEGRIRAAARSLDARIRSDAPFAARCREAAGRVARLREAAAEARRPAPGKTRGGTEAACAQLLEAATAVRSASA